MRFLKWFGRRSEAHDGDEPARFAPPPAAARPAPALRKPQQQKGFDPYNSGAFERRNAWERVSRR